MLLTASTTWYLEDMRQDHLWTFQCPTAMLRLSSSQRKRERLKTTTTTLPLSLLYLNLLPGMSVNDGIIEELPNSQKEEGGLWRRRWLLEMTIVQAEIGMMHSICDLLPMLSAYMAIGWFVSRHPGTWFLEFHCPSGWPCGYQLSVGLEVWSFREHVGVDF